MTPFRIEMSRRILQEIVQGTRTRVFIPNAVNVAVVGRCVLIAPGEAGVPALVHNSFISQVCELSSEAVRSAGYTTVAELLEVMQTSNPDLNGASIITGIDLRLTKTGLALI